MRNQIRAKQTLTIVALFLYAVVGAVFAASFDTAHWNTYKGDFLAYTRANLPMPVAIYAYNKTGVLMGVVETKGKYTPDEMQHVKTTIASTSFTAPPNYSLGKIGKSFKKYLADQGYKASKIINGEARYSLIIVEWDTSNLGCEWLTEKNAAYEKVVDDAIAVHKSVFAVSVIKLSSQQVEISCKKP